ncbi:MAG: DUF262 domain-containing protein [Lachnospiraceae bacterium]|nr:DUF262 domain-containing protein [Lachnospiraceae bacterium]
MNKTTSKIVQISDIVQWSAKGELELSPKYQRNNVWNDKAKAYLMDTIIRGLPIPPIFLRQKVDINTKSTSREIIDGQQRIRAILEYVVDEKFAIKKSHNKEYGGKKYSDLDDDAREAILEFEIVAEVVTEKDEGLIYDMFARLNSNNYVLNKQEIRNSKYWGDFKVMVYNLASLYRDFFLRYKLLSDNDCTRMRDAELITSMLILLIDGIVSETPTSIDKTYEKYDSSFDADGVIENKIESIMDVIESAYHYLEGNLACLNNKNYFFTFYAVVTHQMYGIKDSKMTRNEKFSDSEIRNNLDSLYSRCANFLNDYAIKVADVDPSKSVESEWAEFKKNHSSRTTNKPERTKRISFLNRYFVGEDNGEH